MPVFLYKAVDIERKQAIEGTLEAADDREARAALRARGIMPLTMTTAQPAAEAEAAPLRRLLAALTHRPVPPIEIAVFARQLGAMLEAGMPVVQAIEMLEPQTASATLRDALVEVRHDLLGGHMLGDALARRPRVFPPLMIHLTRVGELSGNLADMYQRLADMVEKDVDLSRKIKAALSYPALVLLVLGGVLLVLLGFVVPTFSTLFARGHAVLPLPTQLLMGMSAIGQAAGAQLLALLALAVVGYRWWRRTPAGKPIADRLWLHVPIFGPLLRDQAANTFARAFGTVYGAGVPVVPALAACRELIDNAVVADLIVRAEAEVAAGHALADQLQGSPYFPPILAHMIAIGEASGRLEDLTARAVSFSDREIEHKIRQLTSLLEPVLTLVIGGVVLFVALALYLPLFDLPKLMTKG